MQYSAIDSEVLGLKFAVDANAYYLYGAKCINIYTDASALEGIFQKNLGDIQNKRIQDMVAKLMCYNFKFHHIPGKSNKIADCFSRMTRRIMKSWCRKKRGIKCWDLHMQRIIKDRKEC